MQDATPSPTDRARRIVAFMNQKGGVGKTTTTVNVAAAFARAGRSTMVVDLDPQAHATLHLGVDASEPGPSVYTVLSDPAADPRSALRQVREHLSLLPAETNLAGIEAELANANDRQRRLRSALARLADHAEFVLIDCPPSLGMLTLNGLTACEEVVIPMQAHFLALQGVGKLLETIQLVRQNLNASLRVAGVVLCAHDAGSTHSREVVADMEAFFAHGRNQPSPWQHARVLKPPIRRNIKLAEAPSFGKSIFEYAPTSAGAEDYNALAWGLLGEWDAKLAMRAQPDAPQPSIAVRPLTPTVAASQG
jgi:chromosome partitioning protein